MARRTSSSEWGATEAKARFSEVMERALSVGPQRVTRHGRRAVIVIAEDELRKGRARATKGPTVPAVGSEETVGAFLRRSPLWGSGLVIDRPRSILRDPFGPNARGSLAVRKQRS